MLKTLKAQVLALLPVLWWWCSPWRSYQTLPCKPHSLHLYNLQTQHACSSWSLASSPTITCSLQAWSGDKVEPDHLSYFTDYSSYWVRGNRKGLDGRNKNKVNDFRQYFLNCKWWVLPYVSDISFSLLLSVSTKRTDE